MYPPLKQRESAGAEGVLQKNINPNSIKEEEKKKKVRHPERKKPKMSRKLKEKKKRPAIHAKPFPCHK